MISVHQAIEVALKESAVLGTQAVPTEQAAGYILAEDVLSDVDMPPFDKSSMDGYALRAADVQNVPAALNVVGFIAAGDYPDFQLGSAEAAQIMTGAPLPVGADSVQMVEKTESTQEGKIRILESVTVGKHVAKKSEVVAANSAVLACGTRLTPASVGVLAAVGKKDVQVYRRPRVGILITGNELVDVATTPAKGQIRNSNGYALFSQVSGSGCTPVVLGIASDDLDELTDKIREGLSTDILLITGGVSMGELDLVEDVFARLGVEIFYDKVNIKPGKPTVFGRHGSSLVFGLPGNPVSASTVFEVIVRPALRKMLGFERLHNVRVRATLTREFVSRTKRENYPPAWTFLQESQFCAEALPSKGSADVVAFSRSNSHLIVPSEITELKSGQQVEVLLRDEFWQTCLLRPESS